MTVSLPILAPEVPLFRVEGFISGGGLLPQLGPFGVGVQVFPAVGIAVVHVLGVGSRVGEALATLVALVGFFSRVKAGVLDQVVLVLEGFLADLALVRPFPWGGKK